MEVALFGGLESDRSYSMVHYGEALQAALAGRFGEGNRFRMVRGVGLRLPQAIAGRPRLAALVREGIDLQVRYPRQARRQQAELNHVLDHSCGSLAGALPAGRTVVTCHDLIPLRVPEIFRTVFSRATGRRWYLRSVRTMLRVGRIIAISENTKADVVTLLGGDAERIVVIPHGIDPRFRPIRDWARPDEVQRRLGLPMDALFVLHVGSCMAYKNIPALIEVFRQVAAGTEEPVWLVHIGGPFPRCYQQLLRAWGLDRRVFSLDGLAVEDLAALYNLASVLVFPSLYEGLGLPLVEAMACGTPVVASNAASIPEVVGDAGLLFAPNDAAGMAGAVTGILKNPELAGEMVERGFRRARRFSWPLVSEQVFGVYEALLKADPGLPASGGARGAID